MEFNFNINIILKDVITKVDSQLNVCRNANARFPDARAHLFEIIDKMGEASARAQGLPGAITTGRKLEMSEHHLYIMKDSEGTRGHGSVVGILKIGRKRLFVYDRHGQQWEMNPMCILDFYVHESRQRMGCGRRLFDFMLKNENSYPQHFAVDRPSHKFASFLAKHYGLRDEIPQVNNFVIFDGFFTKRPDGDFIHNRRNTNNVRPADYPNRGGMSNYNHSQGYNNYNNKTQGYHRSHTSGLPGAGGHWNSNNNVAAGLPSVKPRHQEQQQESSLRDLNINPRSANNSSSSGNMSPRGLNELELRSVSAGSSTNRGLNGLQLQSTMYSRHQLAAPSQPSPPKPVNPAAHRPWSGKDAVTSRPPTSAKMVQPSASDTRITQTTREKSPPLLQRGGPPLDYKESLNMHQAYQGRAGHLVVTSDPRTGHSNPTADTTVLPPMKDSGRRQPDSVRSAYGGGVGGGYYTSPAFHNNSDTSWTVFGVLRNQQQLSARNFGHSRLW